MDRAFRSALGAEWINIARHGVKKHPGILVSDTNALMFFSRARDTIVSLWYVPGARSLKSTRVDLVLDPFCVGVAETELLHHALAEVYPEYESWVKPGQFSNGHSLEFAAALQDLRPDLEIALIGAVRPDEDGEEGETCFAASHAVIVDPEDASWCWDAGGRQGVFELIYDFFPGGDGKPQLLRGFGGLQDAESYLGASEPEAQERARKYIEQRSLMFDGLGLQFETAPQMQR